MAEPPKPAVRDVPGVLFQSGEIIGNRTALYGSLIGLVLLTGGLAALLRFGPGFAEPPEDAAELEMEFLPGELLRFGAKSDPTPSAPMDPSPAATPDLAPTVTDQDTPEPRQARVVRPTPAPEVKPPQEAPPAVQPSPGDPFGDPEGWSEVLRAGDPWATEVMKALSGLEVGSYAGEGQGGEYKFRLEVCPDGRLRAQRKGSTLEPSVAGALEAEIGRQRVPIPASVRDRLAGECQKIKYLFTWRSTNEGRGTVQ